MKIKLLRRFCADEVKLMLERMDSNFDEFQIDGSKWDPLLPHGDGFRLLTPIEQHCIRSEYMAHLEKHRKAHAYQEILERAMSPAKTKWEYNERRVGVQEERPRSAKVLTASAMASQAQQILEQEYQRAYAQQAQNYANQKINYEAQALQKLMGDVQFELRKCQMQIDLEKHVIEHQEFLRKHAPRGY